MAIIEFKNIETQTAFLKASSEDRKEQYRLRRGLYLLKKGLWFPGWDN